jgi:hypothetical protein
MTEPFDFVTWNLGQSSVSEVQTSHWRKLIKKGRHDAYNQCLRFLYDIVAFIALYNMIFIVLKQLVHW